MKRLQSCLSARENLGSSLHRCGWPSEVGASQFVCGKNLIPPF